MPLALRFELRHEHQVTLHHLSGNLRETAENLPSHAQISATSRFSGPTGNAILGDARHWDTAAHEAGYAASRTPVVGAVAQWHVEERSTWSVPGGYAFMQAGSAGHVGVVRAVYSDGTAPIQAHRLAPYLFR